MDQIGGRPCPSWVQKRQGRQEEHEDEEEVGPQEGRAAGGNPVGVAVAAQFEGEEVGARAVVVQLRVLWMMMALVMVVVRRTREHGR